MPHITGPVNHRAHLEIIADEHNMRYESRVLQVYSTVPLDDNCQRFMYPGMIIAENSAGTYYVPYNASAAYGTGSDTAVGVLREFWNCTLGDPIVDVIVHGKLLEKHCFVLGGAVGTVPAGVKTDLPDIKWV
jgi:hypothetical protein